MYTYTGSYSHLTLKSPGKSACNRKRNSNTDICRHICIYYMWYCVKVNLCIANNCMPYTLRVWSVGKKPQTGLRATENLKTKRAGKINSFSIHHYLPI